MSSRLLLALSSILGSLASGSAFLPITGTFMNVQYDARLTFANSAAFNFTCAQWRAKVAEWSVGGVSLIIFQAVHFDLYGAFFPSPSLPHWGGVCGDVVGAVLDGAEAVGSRVVLSCEWDHSEEDGVTPATMQGRLAILHELAELYRSSTALFGWYFASEAVLTPYFSSTFFSYVANLSVAARAATPAATFILVSPYGTRDAAGDATFAAQLRALAPHVDVIAYQDEVGCVRDELPIATVAAAWGRLAQAHALAGGAPQLWANVEAFTWQNAFPNNVTTPLVPAPSSRLLAQIAAASPFVTGVITFSAQAMMDPPGSPQPWGPAPDAARAWSEWRAFYDGAAPQVLLGTCVGASHALPHAAVGATITALLPPPQRGPTAALVDGLCGGASPFTEQYVVWDAPSPTIDIVVALAGSVRVRGGAVQALVVSREWLVDGIAKTPILRNVSAGAPLQASFFGANKSLQPGASGWQELGTADSVPWFYEGLDIRTELLQWNSSSAVAVEFVWVSVAARAGSSEGIILGEVAINPTVD